MNERTADQRILRGTAATLRWTNLDGDGTAADPGAAVAVTVTKADGTAVTSGAATETGATKIGEHTYALTAAQTAALDIYTAVWEVTGAGSFTTYVEIVGGYYFSLEEARRSDPVLADTTKYPDADILAARREVEDEFEEITGVAFVPRYARLTLDGGGCYSLGTPLRRLRSVRSLRAYTDVSTAAYTAYTADELADLVIDDAGIIRRSSGAAITSGVGNVVVEVEHGYDRPPSDVKRAALTRLRHRLNFTKTSIPDRAQAFVVAEGGTFSLASAGRDRTGIPEVDAVLARYSMKVPGLA